MQGKRSFKPRECNSNNLRQFGEHWRRLQMRSKYTEHFAVTGEKFAMDSDILKFKPLKELPCSCVLNRRAMSYLDRWIRIDQDSDYKTAVLATLRSLHSVIEIKNAIPTTT